VAFSLKVFRDYPLVLLINLIKRKIRMKKQWNDNDRGKPEVLGGKIS
jgi:hypothetical protein